MIASLFAVRVEEQRIAAAEISSETAAAMLDEGRSVLLATELELARLARRQNKTLVVFAQPANLVDGANAAASQVSPPHTSKTARAAGRRPGRIGDSRWLAGRILGTWRAIAGLRRVG
jgi:hypothetical protein